jgi:hypothetical protein
MIPAKNLQNMTKPFDSVVFQCVTEFSDLRLNIEQQCVLGMTYELRILFTWNFLRTVKVIKRSLELVAVV